MARVIDEIQVCQDCLMIIASGDESGIDEKDLKRVRAGVRALEGYACAGDSEKDGGFSWRPCECCNGLAGERFHVVLLGDE